MINQKEHDAYRTIVNIIEEFPSVGVSAVMDGLKATIRELERRNNELRFALTCAIGLANDKRITAEVKQIFCDKIVAAIGDDKGICETDRDFLNKHDAAP